MEKTPDFNERSWPFGTQNKAKIPWSAKPLLSRAYELASALKHAFERRYEIFFKWIYGARNTKSPNNLICLEKAETASS